MDGIFLDKRIIRFRCRYSTNSLKSNSIERHWKMKEGKGWSWYNSIPPICSKYKLRIFLNGYFSIYSWMANFMITSDIFLAQVRSWNPSESIKYSKKQDKNSLSVEQTPPLTSTHSPYKPLTSHHSHTPSHTLSPIYIQPFQADGNT